MEIPFTIWMKHVKASDEKIKKLEQELADLQKINAELYGEFNCLRLEHQQLLVLVDIDTHPGKYTYEEHQANRKKIWAFIYKAKE